MEIKPEKIASEQGVKVDLIPEDFTAEGLLEEFEKKKYYKSDHWNSPELLLQDLFCRKAKSLTIKLYLLEAYKSLFPMDEDKISDLMTKNRK